VRGEVLGFVDDKKDIGEAAAPDVGQGGNHQAVVFLKFLDPLVFRTAGIKYMFDDPQVIIKGLHIGVDFLHGIARQETQIAVAQGHDRACQEDLLKLAVLLEGGRQGQQGFPGTRLPRQGNQLDLRISKHINAEGLLRIPGLDPIDAFLFQPPHQFVGSIIPGQHTRITSLQDKTLVGLRLVTPVHRQHAE